MHDDNRKAKNIALKNNKDVFNKDISWLSILTLIAQL